MGFAVAGQAHGSWFLSTKLLQDTLRKATTTGRTPPPPVADGT